jgi:pimeloyl-ACP methyl ester carboxylesterase
VQEIIMRTQTQIGRALIGAGLFWALHGPAAVAAPPVDAAPAVSAQTGPGTALTHHMIEANGIRLHYVTAGHGEPLVLLHGFGETWYEWHDLIPALAARYTVIAPDLRGAGDSERPLVGYDKKTMAEDIHALVHQLGATRIDLVGHDIGLMVAYAYAAAYPTEVRHLVLVDAPIPGIGDWDAVKAHEWHFAFSAVPDLPEALVAGHERLYLTTAFYYAKAYNPAAFTEERIDEYVRHYEAPGAMRAAFAYFGAFPEDEKQNKIYAETKLPMPVLAVGGAESYGPQMLPMAQSVATNVTGGSIADCGHWVPVEQPQELTRRILAFCGDGRP